MIDITHKSNTLRTAVAQAIVRVSSDATMEAIRTGTVPKGNVLEAARTAGLFAVKRTSDMIPDCHPIPIEYTAIRFELTGLEISIQMEVKTIYKTGVEVEAMHGVSVVALTMYDMLKPIDKGIEISEIKLIEKKGGKSDQKNLLKRSVRAAVIVCSDTIAAGKNEDLSGLKMVEILKQYGIEISEYVIIPDDAAQIHSLAVKHTEAGTDIILFTGGTGLSGKDITPETLAPLIDREIPGIMETARNYGQQRMPYAMLSRGIAGMRGRSLIITVPGSVHAVQEYMSALFPHILHIFNTLDGERHTKS